MTGRRTDIDRRGRGGAPELGRSTEYGLDMAETAELLRSGAVGRFNE